MRNESFGLVARRATTTDLQRHNVARGPQRPSSSGVHMSVYSVNPRHTKPLCRRSGRCRRAWMVLWRLGRRLGGAKGHEPAFPVSGWPSNQGEGARVDAVHARVAVHDGREVTVIVAEGLPSDGAQAVHGEGRRQGRDGSASRR